MRRSIQPRVRSQGELYFEATGGRVRAELVNLSRGGLCARGELPRGADDTDRPMTLQVALGLLDGTPPITASAAVAWVKPEGDGERFGLRFIDLSGDARARLDAAIAARVDSVPILTDGPAPMRLRLGNGPVLRAEVDSIDDVAAQLGAELPWLRVGDEVEIERNGIWVPARTSWVGLDVTAAGVARLRLRLAFQPSGRRDTTLRYFDARAARAELEAPSTPFEVRTDEVRAHELVRLGLTRRRRLAILRTLVALLSLSAIYLGARSLRAPAPAVADVPIEVRPAPREPAPTTAVESERSPPIEELPAPSIDEPAAAAMRKATPAKKARPRR